MRLIIPKEVEARIHDYVMAVDSEIAGMGRVHTEGADTIIVDEIMIYKQEATAGTADLSPQAIAKWQSELVKAGGSPKEWRLWWHSHDNMPAFFSQRDTDTMDTSTEGEWMVSLVVNKRRERQARLDLYRPFRVHMDKLEVAIGDGEAYKVPADIAAEVAEKVGKPSYTLGYGYGKKGKNTAIARPYDIEPEQEGTPEDLAEMVAYCKEIEAQLITLRDMGGQDSEEYTDLQAELADWYYTLAEAMPDKKKAANIRAEADILDEQATEAKYGRAGAMMYGL